MFAKSLNSKIKKSKKMHTSTLKILSVIMCSFLSVYLNGQELEVSGIITDGISGESIPGATILIKGTSEGTISDFDGTYFLTVNSLSDTIEISFIGCKTKEVAINGRQVINEQIFVDSYQIDEIIVVGYGRQKKKVVTGAVARVSNEDINSTPSLRIEQALQGRTPGVQVTNQSGQPGDEPTVRVRGIGTTGNAKPLYIVDGLAVGGIDYLNPGDIETIDILKDAASAAIYGARAANGVVLVTTKSGSKGKLSVSYDGYYGLQNATNQLDMLNADQYKMIMNEGARSAGVSEPFDLLEISVHNTNWQDALFIKNAPMQNHQLSVQVGENALHLLPVFFFSRRKELLVEANLNLTDILPD